MSDLLVSEQLLTVSSVLGFSGAEMNEGAAIDRVPLEVLSSKIFTKFPVKPLLCFRSVRKDWRVVIDDHEFRINHFNANLFTKIENPSSIILIPTTSEELPITPRPKIDGFYFVEEEPDRNFRFTKMDLPYPEDSWLNYSVLGASHGLICLSSCNSLSRSGCSMFICNPITREYLKLPSYGHHGRYLSFGFGFLPSTKEFKVVGIHIGITDVKRVAVYVRGSNSWKTIPCVSEVHLPRGQGGGLFLNGSVHWADKNEIISFDMELETFGVIPLPELHLGVIEPFLKLGVLRGCLSLSYCKSPGNPFEIWVMEHYNVRESWNRCVVTRDIIMGGIYVSAVLPLYFRANGDLVLLCNSKFLVSYNENDREATPLWDHELRSYAYSSAIFGAFPFARTLISPKLHNGGTGQDGHTKEIARTKKRKLQVYTDS